MVTAKMWHSPYFAKAYSIKVLLPAFPSCHKWPGLLLSRNEHGIDENDNLSILRG
jgi:hypothetical protein